MPRRIEIAVPEGDGEGLASALGQTHGIIGLQVQHGASRLPKGDVVAALVTNDELAAFMRLLAEREIGMNDATSYSTSEPVSVVSRSLAGDIVRDSSEASWEEMELVIGKNSNMMANALTVMAVSGALAAIGIATNALHIVVGAMLIAPGFQPIVRISLGLASQSGAWLRGVEDTLKAYGALVVGAAVTTVFLRATGTSPLGDETSYLPAGTLISYWINVNGTSVAIAVVASAAGTILVATDKAVLTAGVMVALALVPGATIFAMALAMGEWQLALQGLLRWLVEGMVLLAASAVVLGWKRWSVHRRRMMI